MESPRTARRRVTGASYPASAPRMRTPLGRFAVSRWPLGRDGLVAAYGRARGELHARRQPAIQRGDRVDQVVLAHPPGATVALPWELVDRAQDVPGAEVEERSLLEL